MNMQKKTIDEILNETLKVLRDGGVILYPTDTVWGLGCDATNPEAVAKIYEIKHRSDSKSLVLLASSLDQIALYVNEIPPMAIDLVEVNDRPMTLIYPGAKPTRHRQRESLGRLTATTWRTTPWLRTALSGSASR